MKGHGRGRVWKQHTSQDIVEFQSPTDVGYIGLCPGILVGCRYELGIWA
jgi:hypothetical protein